MSPSIVVVCHYFKSLSRNAPLGRSTEEYYYSSVFYDVPIVCRCVCSFVSMWNFSAIVWVCLFHENRFSVMRLFVSDTSVHKSTIGARIKKQQKLSIVLDSMSRGSIFVFSLERAQSIRVFSTNQIFVPFDWCFTWAFYIIFFSHQNSCNVFFSQMDVF